MAPHVVCCGGALLANAPSTLEQQKLLVRARAHHVLEARTRGGSVVRPPRSQQPPPPQPPPPPILPPSSRGLVTETGLDRLAVDPSRKLMFCAIDKCAQSLQLTLLHALAGRRRSDWPFDMAPRSYGASVEDVARWIDDDAWTRIVVIRDPVERWVSAFNSKCMLRDPDGKQVPRHTRVGRLRARARTHAIESHIYPLVPPLAPLPFSLCVRARVACVCVRACVRACACSCFARGALPSPLLVAALQSPLRHPSGQRHL